MDKTDYKVTYRQLDTILRRHNFGLSNPDKNQIVLIKVVSESTGLFNRDSVQKEKRITSIGFPGSTRQVNVDAVKKVRRFTGLTVENDYDSETFFHNADSLPVLISEFQHLLKRLADK